MLDHQKTILKGLHNDVILFQKELYKSFKWLTPQEAAELIEWVKDNFKQIYNEHVSEFVKRDQYPIY